MDLSEAVRTAGAIGAGGAGFPTHVKLLAKTGLIIVNGVECEPLLRVERVDGALAKAPVRVAEVTA